MGPEKQIWELDNAKSLRRGGGARPIGLVPELFGHSTIAVCAMRSCARYERDNRLSLTHNGGGAARYAAPPPPGVSPGEKAHFPCYRPGRGALARLRRGRGPPLVANRP